MILGSYMIFVWELRVKYWEVKVTKWKEITIFYGEYSIEVGEVRFYLVLENLVLRASLFMICDCRLEIAD